MVCHLRAIEIVLARFDLVLDLVHVLLDDEVLAMLECATVVLEPAMVNLVFILVLDVSAFWLVLFPLFFIEVLVNFELID